MDSLTLTDKGMLVAEGWAFSGPGVEVIAIEVDDEAVGEAVISLPRPDVGNAYPLISNARWGGFRVSKNLGRRFEGEHTVVLTVQDAVERRVIPLSVVATGRQQDSGVIEFNIDSPIIEGGRAVDPVYGDLPIVGWAVAPSGIDHVEVFLNEEPKGNAYFGARRNDIKGLFATMHDPASSGFGMSIPKRWGAGTHDVGSSSTTEVETHDSKNSPLRRDHRTTPRDGGCGGRSSRPKSTYNWQFAMHWRSVRKSHCSCVFATVVV